MDTQTKTPILINADLGEGCKTAVGECSDQLILPHIDMANIACGGHAGSASTIATTITAALIYKVRIGAHPSYPDRENFGREAMELSTTALGKTLIDQLTLIRDIAHQKNTELNHIKPHGALYNQAAVNKTLATQLINIFQQFDPKLPIVALANSALAIVAKEKGLNVIEEGFVDRRYTQHGLLTARSEPNAVIEETREALQQAAMIIDRQQVNTADQKLIPLHVQTLCLHGDGKQAIALAEGLRTLLKQS